MANIMKKTPKRLQNTDSQTLFEAISKAFLTKNGITEKKMFGTTALCVKGKVFAFPMKGKLIVKLPKERVAEIVALKKGVYFDPGHGRISKEWVAIQPKAQSEWLGLAGEAKEFVASLKE